MALLVATLALAPQAVHAASQTRSPGACATGGGAGNAWNNPNNALSSNNADATVSTDGNVSEALQCTSYGFNIPAGATIVGIVVNLERASSSTADGGSRDSSLTLTGGTLAGSNLATTTTYTTGDVIEAHGNATETWGNTWTPAQINATAFGAALRVTKPSTAGGAHTVSVDHMPITVHYSTAPPAPTLVSPADGGEATTPAPTFDWTDVVDPDGDSVTYEMQADNSGCAFASPEVDASALAASTLTPGLLAAGTYCWRARAVDQFGVAGAWSATRDVVIPVWTSQTRSPGACTTGGPGTAWTNPGNAVSSNNADATVSVDGTTSETLQCTGYGFTIPAEMSILGIVVNVERASSSAADGGSRDSSLTLTGGTLAGSNLATTTPYTTADVIEAHGDTTETWGNTWTPAQINADAFGAGLRVTKPSTAGAAHTVSVDHMPITVYYIQLSPTLVSATFACGTTNQVKVRFSRAVTAASAQNPANYSLSGGASVTGAALDSSGQVVTLTVSGLAASQGYTVTVNNIVGATGGSVAANSQATFFTELGDFLPGLVGTYYDQNAVQRAYFTGATVERIDAPVNFDWGTAAPVAGIGADDFSVIWEGFVTPTTSGSYTFGTRSDDGVRLYVNGVLVIDNWTDHSTTDNTSPATTLVAGQRYAVRMEFYERGTDAVAHLRWNGPGTGGTVAIPAANLSHCGTPRPTPLAFYKMDELSWDGTPGEVVDSSGNGFNGRSIGNALPAPAKVCNGALLNASTGTPTRYVEIPHSPALNTTTNLTVAVWINPNAWPASDLMTIASKDTNWEFHVTPAGQINWWWNTGATALTTSVPGGAAPLNTWTHVAIVYAQGAQTLYVNGVSRATGTDASALTTNTAALQIGDDLGAVGRMFRGQIDEVRIYNQTLTASDIATIMNDTRPCAVVMDHFSISHAGSGVACDTQTITITAHDSGHNPIAMTSMQVNLSTSNNKGTWTGIVSGGGALSNVVAGAGTATYQFAAGSSTVQLSFRYANLAATSETFGFNVSGSGYSEATGVATASEDPAFTISQIGFVFRNATDGSNVIPTQISGKPSNVGWNGKALTLRAVRTDDLTLACAPLFPAAGIRSVDLGAECNNPATCGTPASLVSVNGSNIATSANNAGAGATGYTSVSLTFNPASEAPIVVAYPDAGQISLHARYDLDTDVAGYEATGSSNAFVVRPFGLAFPGIAHSNSATTTPIGAAGDNFSMTVRAYRWASGEDSTTPGTPNANADITDNGEVPNFAATVTVAPGASLPAVALGSIARGVNCTNAATIALTGGTATGADWCYSEAGNVILTATVNDYLGAGDADITGSSGFDGGASGGYVGRFRPKYFNLVGTPTRTHRSATVPCNVGSTFTYMGEKLGLAFSLAARNAQGATTQNYSGSYAKLDVSLFASFGFRARNNAAPATDLSARVDAGSTPSGSWVNGVANMAVATGITRAAAPDGPFAAVEFGIAPVDSDNVAMQTLNFDADGNSVNEATLLATGQSEVRYGRLSIGNAFGSQSLNLPVPLELQYYNGSFYVANPLDSCTPLVLGNFSLGGATGTLTSVAAGKATLRITKPGIKVSYDLCADLDGTPATDASCVATTPANKPWLQWKWTGLTYDKDPKAKASFGIFKNADEFIYLREMY